MIDLWIDKGDIIFQRAKIDLLIRDANKEVNDDNTKDEEGDTMKVNSDDE